MEKQFDLSEERCVELAVRASEGDASAASELFDGLRNQVIRYIDLRLDGPLRSRLDAADIWQETLIEANRRLNDFVARRPMPFRAWIIKTAQKKLGHAREKHLVRDRRNASRDVPLHDQSSMLLAQKLATYSSPSRHAMNRERRQILAELISQLEQNDRDILLLRHTEEFDFREIASILDISYANARQRHVRALLRLRDACMSRGIEFEV